MQPTGETDGQRPSIGWIGFPDEHDRDRRLSTVEPMIDEGGEVGDVFGHHDPAIGDGGVEDDRVRPAGEAEADDRDGVVPRRLSSSAVSGGSISSISHRTR